MGPSRASPPFSFSHVEMIRSVVCSLLAYIWRGGKSKFLSASSIGNYNLFGGEYNAGGRYTLSFARGWRINKTVVGRL